MVYKNIVMQNSKKKRSKVSLFCAFLPNLCSCSRARQIRELVGSKEFQHGEMSRDTDKDDWEIHQSSWETAFMIHVISIGLTEK